MKKKFLLVLILGVLLLTACGNKDIFDTNYTYDKAIVEFPGGEVKELEIRQWSDYEGEQIQIITKDGKIYLINSVNAVLIRE